MSRIINQVDERSLLQIRDLMKNHHNYKAGRTEYKAQADRPSSNSKTFLKEQSSVRLSRSSSMPIVLRTSYSTLLPQSRTSFDTLKKMNAIRNRAAIIIQAHWRGYAVRRRLKRQYLAMNRLHAASEGYKTQKYPSTEYKPISLNHSNYRSYQNRDDLRAQDLRAAQIQKEWREFLQRQQIEQRKSSLAIQTHYRDPWSATQLFVQARAATIIQSWYRGYKIRKALKLIKQKSSLRLGRSSNRYSFMEPSGTSLQKNTSQPIESSSKSGAKASTVPTFIPESSWMSAELKSDRGKNLQPKQQHSIGKNTESVVQSSFSNENSHSNRTENIEREYGCSKTASVVQPMEMQQRFKFEAMDNKTYPKGSANPKSLVQSRPPVPLMAFSTQFHCRRTITPGNSSVLPQDKSRERAKSSCDIAWPEKNKGLLPYRSDYKPSGQACGPEPFRRKQARSYSNNQLNSKLVERRKSLYEGKIIEPCKYPPNKPPAQVYGPSIGWRKMSYNHISEPQFQQSFKGQERTAFCDRQNDQENISSSRDEQQASESLYNTDMCTIKAAHDSVVGPTGCQPTEEAISSYDSHSKVHNPPTFPSNADTCMRKVTSDKFIDMPQYRQRELNSSLLDNETEEQAHCFPSGTVHKSTEYSANSMKSKAEYGKFCEQSQGRLHEWTQNNNHNSQDAQNQPIHGLTSLSHRNCSQQLYHKSLTEGTGASNIQCAWKGIQSRVALKRQHDAATRIQSFYRGYRARKYLRTSGILNRNVDWEAMRKEPKAAGDGQRFSIPSRLSPKRDNSHHLQNYESCLHSSRKSGTVEKEARSIRYSRSSFT